MKERIIRALYDENTITVYQAYNRAIAQAAVKAQTFVSPFKQDRMTWIKPSFLWMMYRCGWATKENQEHVLAVKIKREGFEWALKNACLSHFDAALYGTHDAWKAKLAVTPVRIQWDPEKNIHLHELPYRSIQIGLTGPAVEQYLSDWIVQIDDITNDSKKIHELLISGQEAAALKALPQEQVYPLPTSIGAIIKADDLS